MPAARKHSVRAVPDEPNVALRPGAYGQEVVLSFPYDAHLVAAVRTLPGRRFDWDLREWSAPADGWVAAKLAEILRFRPELSRTAEFDEWLANAEQYWVGHVRTARYDGRGWFALDTLAGTPPEALRAIELEGRWLAPLTRDAAAALTELRDPRLSVGARRCLEALEYGEQPPAARLILTRGVAGERFTLETFWDPEIQAAFEQLPGAAANELKLDAWIVDQLDAFLALHEVEVAPPAAEAIAVLAEQHRAAQRAVAASHGRPRPSRWPRWRSDWAACSRPSSGSRSATRSRPAARSSQTSRGLARRSRRWQRSRPTALSRPWSCARRR